MSQSCDHETLRSSLNSNSLFGSCRAGSQRLKCDLLGWIVDLVPDRIHVSLSIEHSIFNSNKQLISQDNPDGSIGPIRFIFLCIMFSILQYNSNMTASFHWKHTPLIWITGMPGSGKSALAAQLTDHLRSNGQDCIHLDGDNLRQILNRENHASDYSLPSRLELAHLYSKLALYLHAQNITIIVSTVSLFWEVQKINRANADFYFEVLLKVEEELLVSGPRSVLYESGVQNEIVPEFPLHPELILRASKPTDRDTWFEKLVGKLGSFCE